MKKCLSLETFLMFDRHLDQIVLCSIYSVCKIQVSKIGRAIKFNDIIKKYKDLQHQLTGASMNIFTSMYTNVLLEGGKSGTIIEFYNKIYIQTMKTYIMGLDPNDNSQMRSPRARIPALGPQSPLKQSLPPPRMTYQTIYASRGVGTPSRYGMNTPGFRNYSGLAMTPRTKTLYVFGESATNELDKANTEIKKTFIRSGKIAQNLNFGGSSKYKNSQSLKSQLIRSMKQKSPSTGIATVAGKPPVGPPPMVIKSKIN